MDTDSARLSLLRASTALLMASEQVQAALASLDNGNPQPPDPMDPPGGRIGLEAFRWALKGKDGRIADPSGLPPGARYGESIEGGRRWCQWEWKSGPLVVLHAVFPAGANAIAGPDAACAWYHFTRAASDGGQPLPALALFHWYASPVNSAGFRKWKRTK